MKDHKLRNLMCLVLLTGLFAGQQGFAEVYKTVDKDGNVVYTDRPPEGGAVGAQEVSTADDPQILWKVESSQNSIYLAGSIHVLQKEHYPLHQAFDDAFNESSRVMFEVDLLESLNWTFPSFLQNCGSTLLHQGCGG